jgi:hypothetical protein
MKLIWIAGATVFGCTLDQPASSFAPADVTTGIYQVSISTDADTCSPARFTGSGSVPVEQAGSDQLVLVAYTPANSNTFTLAAAQEYADEISNIDPCPGQAGDSVAIELSLISATATRVEVAENQTWELASTCDGAVFAATVPSTSCGAAQTLTYDLVQACASPCTAQTDGSGALSCVCD